MKKIIILLFAIIFVSCSSKNTITQNKQKNSLQTEKYAGVYSYGSNSTDDGAIGHITVFPETDNTVLFYISLNLGPKSYNGGALYGRLTLKGNKGVFNSSRYTYQGTGCKWDVSIQSDTITIKTLDGNCGFGHNVTAGGTYLRKNNSKPDFFENVHSQKIFFSKTNPEDYNNDDY